MGSSVMRCIAMGRACSTSVWWLVWKRTWSRTTTADGEAMLASVPHVALAHHAAARMKQLDHVRSSCCATGDHDAAIACPLRTFSARWRDQHGRGDAHHPRWDNPCPYKRCVCSHGDRGCAASACACAPTRLQRQLCSCTADHWDNGYHGDNRFLAPIRGDFHAVWHRRLPVSRAHGPGQPDARGYPDLAQAPSGVGAVRGGNSTLPALNWSP